MKYIRTKDRVCAYDEFINSDYYLIFGEEEIVKQADTIEELCDVFVGVDENGEHHTHTDSVNDLIHMTYDILHVTLTTIYGEIWVNDELHKVAKLNDKGELELL